MGEGVPCLFVPPTALLLSQRKHGILAVGNPNGGAMLRSLRRFLTRLGNFAATRRHDERLQEEIEEHLALQTAENLRAGLPPAEARRQARLKFGAVEAIKEEYRTERRMRFIETLLQDI